MLRGLLALLEIAGEDSSVVQEVLKNRKARRKIAAAIRDQYAEYVQDGGEMTFWEWLWENREDILQFIMTIISILAAL
jgi:hypothetical protein